MQIQLLQLENFRNYETFKLSFEKKILLIRGKNTQGKTNLLEALFTLAIGKSFRHKNLEEVIRWGEDYLRIQGILSNGNQLELFYSQRPSKQKVSKINQVKKNLNDFVGHFLCVLFTPENIDLVSSAPGERRRFLDMLLSQISHDYLIHLLNYQKILKQRNKLLKAISEGKSKEDELDFWDTSLVKHGTVITEKRKNFFLETANFLETQYQNISGLSDKLELKYLCRIEDTEKYLEKLIKNRQRDILLSETLSGPHRDDFEFILNQKSLTTFGSRGEYRSSILALKLSELYFIELQTGQKPILLLDDVFSELDSNRQKYLIEAIEHQQTIITTTDDTILDLDEKEIQILEL